MGYKAKEQEFRTFPKLLLFCFYSLIFLLNKHHSVCRDTLHTSGEPKFLRCRGLDGYVVYVSMHHFCQTLLHLRNVGIELWTLGANRGVHISETISLCGDEVNGLCKQYLTVHIKRFCCSIGEVIADVAHVGSTKQGVADGMYEYVSVAMTEQSQLIIELYAAKPKLATFHQLVDVISESCSYLHDFYLRLKRSFMPSISKDSVKRNVWSSGFDFAVAIT